MNKKYNSDDSSNDETVSDYNNDINKNIFIKKENVVYESDSSTEKNRNTKKDLKVLIGKGRSNKEYEFAKSTNSFNPDITISSSKALNMTILRQESPHHH
jgi:hypothetical protein